ncbi:MAG: DUF2391 family protein [Halorientalis sp.]
MFDSMETALRNQIRGITGAMLVLGLSFHYTMETWWLAWTLPMAYIVSFAVLGLGLVLAITRTSGFRFERGDDERWVGTPWGLLVDFTEILLQSFVTAYVVLLMLGIIDLDSSASLIVRVGLLNVVPLGFGAALANTVFGGESEEEAGKELQFPRNLGLFSIGALFIGGTIAPTQELALLTVYMGWVRDMGLILCTLLFVYLLLYELDFKGQSARLSSTWEQLGTTCLVYAVAVVISATLLLGFGQFTDATAPSAYQKTVTLAFPAALAGAGVEVIV